MLIGLASYLAGYPTYVRSVRTAPRAPSTARLTSAQWRVIAGLLVVMLLTVFQSIAYYQNGDAAMLWIDQDVNLRLLGLHIPTAWFNSIDPLVSMIAVPFLLAFWRLQARRGREPSEIGKIAIGAWIACVANLVLVLGCAVWHPVPAVVPALYDVLLGIAFLYYWPTLLALVSREAPLPVRATLMGAVFMTLFLSYSLLGWLGSFYARMTPLEFWAMHAAVAGVGGLLVLLSQRPLLATFGESNPCGSDRALS